MTVGEIMKYTRKRVGKSQSSMAEALNVEVRTIGRWENGKSEPTVSEMIEWFRAVGENPIPYMFILTYPDEFALEESENADNVERLYALMSENLTPEDKLALVYIYSGNHGSSPASVIQLTLAHLCNPLGARILVAEHIVEDYKLKLMNDEIEAPEEFRPNLAMLERAIEAAKESYIDGRKGYSSPSPEDVTSV